MTEATHPDILNDWLNKPRDAAFDPLYVETDLIAETEDGPVTAWWVRRRDSDQLLLCGLGGTDDAFAGLAAIRRYQVETALAHGAGPAHVHTHPRNLP